MKENLNNKQQHSVQTENIPDISCLMEGIQEDNFLENILLGDVADNKKTAISKTSKQVNRSEGKKIAAESGTKMMTKEGNHPAKVANESVLYFKQSVTDKLWKAAAASKEKKPKEKQVWLDENLYRKIEMLNLKNGKKVPTKHVVNAIIKMFLDENR